jgi:hypothetical protein
VPEHRAELVAAALTVLRAFIVAGSPGAEELEAFGRFEAWSMLIRAALVWLGEPDPCISRESIARDDPVRAFAGSLIEMLEAAFPRKEFTAQEAIEAGRATDEVSRELKFPGLQVALMDMIPRSGTYASIAVGRALKKMDGQVRNGLRFEVARGQYSPTRFRIIKPGVDPR